MSESDRLGRRAEDIAVWLLRFKGFHILARRYATKVGEIDIVALRRDLLIFVEVKHRQQQETALAAISKRQQRRITRAAEAYLQRHPQWSHKLVRFDVVATSCWRWPLHLENAWEAEPL